MFLSYFDQYFVVEMKKARYSNTRFNYSRIRVLEKLPKMTSTRVLDTRRWIHYICILLKI
jgi:hypothetical protein